MIKGISIKLRASICVAAIASGAGTPVDVQAQVEIAPVQVPLSDVNCDYTQPGNFPVLARSTGPAQPH
jgi:uncharacterized membrane protein